MASPALCRLVSDRQLSAFADRLNRPQPQRSPSTVRCCLPCIADVIALHGVRCHQYADDTQLHLAIRVDNTAAGLSILTACTTDVKQWYMQNGLQLNPDKSEALFMGTTTHLRAVSSFTSVSVADIDLPMSDWMRVLGVTLDRRLTFDNHASAIARSCNYHARADRSQVDISDGYKKMKICYL